MNCMNIDHVCWWSFCAVCSSDQLRVPACAGGRGSERPADSVEGEGVRVTGLAKLQELADERARGEMRKR